MRGETIKLKIGKFKEANFVSERIARKCSKCGSWFSSVTPFLEGDLCSKCSGEKA
jgi:hypothetical protein